MDRPTSETTVSVHGEINRASDMLPIPLSATFYAQKGLRIQDVATVEDGHVDQRSISRFNDAPTVLLDLNRIVTSDEISTTKIARDQLKTIAKKYPKVTFTEVDAPAEYTEASLAGVVQSLGEGDLAHRDRADAVPARVAQRDRRHDRDPVVAARDRHRDASLRVHARHRLADGALADDRYPRRRLDRRARKHHAPSRLGREARGCRAQRPREIGGAAVAITLVDVVVFLPMAFLSGIVGKYMKEFGVVVVVATMFSLFVSFTLTPGARRKVVDAQAQFRAAVLAGLVPSRLRTRAAHRITIAAARTRSRTASAPSRSVRPYWSWLPSLSSRSALVQSEFVPSTQDGEVDDDVLVSGRHADREDVKSRIANLRDRGHESSRDREDDLDRRLQAGRLGLDAGRKLRDACTRLLDKNRRRETNRAVGDIRKLAASLSRRKDHGRRR